MDVLVGGAVAFKQHHPHHDRNSSQRSVYTFKLETRNCRCITSSVILVPCWSSNNTNTLYFGRQLDYYLAMCFGYGVGDITAISRPAHTAYKDTPDDYRIIADEVNSLHIIIEEAARHFESTALSKKKQQGGKKLLEGRKLLEGCQKILQDLDALIEKYNALASANTSQVLRRIKLGTEIVILRARLILHTTLLNSFMQSCDSHKLNQMQAQLYTVLGLRRSRTLVSYAGSINTNSETSLLPTISTEPNRNRPRFAWAHPPVYFLVGALLGDIKPLKSILGHVRKIDFLDNTGVTALHKAASGGYNDLVQLLLTKGASIEVVNKDNDTSLHLAMRSGHTSTVELLLTQGASIDVVNKDNDTPLHLALRSGHTSTVELLLTQGASIDVVNKDNDTPLHLALRGGHTSTVELLLTQGASVDVVNKDYDTPLHFAAKNGHTSTVELLLSKGAPVDAMNYWDCTPLNDAAWDGHTSTVELLLSKGASINVANTMNFTSLHSAALRGHTSTVKLLLSKGASVEVMDQSCFGTPLHHAMQCGNTSIAELLLSKGASIEAVNRYNYTPLHYAVMFDSTSIVELLLSKGASVDAMDMYNNTPLHLAARYSHTCIVKLLLSKGASMEATNRYKKTPLQIANRFYNVSVMKLLERVKATNIRDRTWIEAEVDEYYPRSISWWCKENH